MPVPRCQVWSAGIDDADDSLRALLAPSDVARLERYRLASDRDRGLVGWALARLLLGDRLGIAPSAIAIDRTCAYDGCANGKPRIGTGASVEFSISHSGARILVAISEDAPVGVDVEALTSNTADLAGLALARDEYARTDDDFIRIWARKEAVVKAVGSGMRTPLDSFAVSAADQPAALRSWPPDPGLPARTTLIDLAEAGPNCAAVAILAADAEVTEHDGSALIKAARIKAARIGSAR